MSDDFLCPAEYLKDGVSVCFPSGMSCRKYSGCSEYLKYKHFNFTSLDIPPKKFPKTIKRKEKIHPDSLELSV